MTDTKNQQIPEEVLEMAKKLGEKLGAKVEIAQLAGGLSDRVKILPRVIFDMYVIAQLITEVTDAEDAKDVDILTIVALSQGMMHIAEDGMPDGFFEKALAHGSAQERKAHFLNIAKLLVADAQKSCDCPKCRANRTAEENSKKTVH